MTRPNRLPLMLSPRLPSPPSFLALALFLIVPVVASCAGTPIRPTPTSTPGEALFNGRTRPEVNCYSCHNGDGTGTWRGPDLTKRVPTLSDAQIVRTIDEGPGLMPSFKGKIDAQETQQVIAWLRERFPNAGK